MKTKSVAIEPRALAYLGTTLAAGLAGFALFGAPSDPDALMGSAHVLGTGLLFAFWALGLFAGGRVLSRAARLEAFGPAMAVALGTAAYALLGMAAGHLGLAAPETLRPILLALTLAALVADVRATPRPPLVPEGTVARIFVALIAFELLTAALAASLPQGHSDPLRYHLLGPRLWSAAGKIYLPSNVPLVLHCSYWEYLYLWGNALVAGPGSQGLVEGQLFAQWTHVFLGYGGCALALLELARRVGAASLSWRLAAVYATLSILTLGTPWSAKSDWGVALWVLMVAQLLLADDETRPRARRAHLALAGALAGLAFAAKITSAFMLTALVGAWLWRSRAERRHAPLVLALAAAAALPVIARNALLTGNPLFPAFSTLFPSPELSESYAKLQKGYEASGLILAPREWLSKLVDLFTTTPLALSVPLVALVKAPRLRLVCAATAAGLLLWGLKVRQDAGEAVRLAGAALPLLAACSVLVVPELLARFKKKKLAPVALALVTLAFAWNLRSTPRLWAVFARYPEPALVLREQHVGGAAKAWLRLNARPTERIVTSGDNQLYYLSNFDVAAITEQPELDRLTRSASSGEDMARALRATGARYWLDTRHFESFFWSGRSYNMATLLKAHPKAVVYAGPDAVIADLSKLP